MPGGNDKDKLVSAARGSCENISRRAAGVVEPTNFPVGWMKQSNKVL